MSYRSILIYICICCLPFISASGQKFLADTIFIDFHTDSMINIGNVHISAVKDQRHEDPRFIRYFTRNKLLLFPVDEEMLIHRPLAGVLATAGASGNIKGKTYQLVIKKFEVEKQSFRFSSSTVLSADIVMYLEKDDSLHYEGTFFYDFPYERKKGKQSVSEITENLLSKWDTQFKLDLLSVNAQGLESRIGTVNFIRDPNVKSLYLNSVATAMYGIKWWGLQGEMYFTRPETDQKNRVQSTLVRYQDNDLYQSVSFGRKAEHLTSRFTPDLSTDVDLNILFGLCKWKDVEINKPTLYQVFDMELSSIQSLLYNPVNRKGFIFRLGVIENLQYIIERPLRFQVGLTAGIGYKF